MIRTYNYKNNLKYKKIHTMFFKENKKQNTKNGKEIQITLHLLKQIMSFRVFTKK